MSKELITRNQVIKAARLLAERHQSAETSDIFSDDGTAQQVWLDANQNIDEITTLLNEQRDGEDLKQLSKWTADQYLKLLFLLDDRKDDGFVRLSPLVSCLEQCNISLDIHQTPWADTLSDLALFIVQLDSLDLSHLTAAAVNRYLEITGDYAGLPLFAFYKVFHAVSAAGNLLKTDQSPETLKTCRRYIELASSYCQNKQPFIIVMQGLSGTGKTTVSKEISEHFNALILRTDVERKRMYGLSALANSTDAGIDIYTSAATEKTYALIKQAAIKIIETHTSVVIDGASLKQTERGMFLTLADELNVPALIVKCLAPREILKVRITKRQSSNADASEATFDLIDQQQQWEEPLTAEEKKKTIVLHTNDSDWEQQLKSAFASHLN
ncbi:bifunctional aminoglycoside phosphotransferase/ATP-binding protein [Endozoicomonas sp. OPT23]|uniref:AAA family ATPase n=1 Tax=Endozoicomonas sp. OPT23 TaxID=2072845 RepID=UPI0018918610